MTARHIGFGKNEVALRRIERPSKAATSQPFAWQVRQADMCFPGQHTHAISPVEGGERFMFPERTRSISRVYALRQQPHVAKVRAQQIAKLSGRKFLHMVWIGRRRA